MKIHEFQAKSLFRRFEIPVPEGQVATSADEVRQLAASLAPGRVVVKAQIHAGGRGKGALVDDPTVHGVQVTQTPDEAARFAGKLLGHALRTHQTGPEGQRVKQVLVETASEIAHEYYLGLVLDRDSGCVTFLASSAGGMDIEEVAAKTPERIHKIAVDPVTGFMPSHGRRIASGLGLSGLSGESGESGKEAAAMAGRLYRLFTELDASLVEVNPLVRQTQGSMIALDGKINLDDNALYRHPELEALRDVDEEDARERQAREGDLSYVALDGNIGCLVNGAGLAMATMDIIKEAGGAPANFLDVGGSATTQRVALAFRIILEDPNVRAILVNIFGGIVRCDVVAEGVLAAAREVALRVPLVVRLEGNNVEKGRALLEGSGLGVVPASDMADAAAKVVWASRGGA